MNELKQNKQAKAEFATKTISGEDVKRIVKLLYDYSAVLAGSDCSELYVIGELCFDCFFEIFDDEVQAYTAIIEDEA